MVVDVNHNILLKIGLLKNGISRNYVISGLVWPFNFFVFVPEPHSPILFYHDDVCNAANIVHNTMYLLLTKFNSVMVYKTVMSSRQFYHSILLPFKHVKQKV